MAKAIILNLGPAKVNLEAGKSLIPPRKGKTRKDHSSGAWARRFANQDARASWRNQGSAKRAHGNFPWTTCNGKRNRTQVTGRGNTVQTFTYR